MWNGIQIAAYAGLILGHLVLLAVATRHRVERGPAQILLEVTILLTALGALALGFAVILFPGEWWLYLWQRAAQVGLVIVALLTAEFANAFLRQPARHWLRIGGIGLLLLAALVAEALTFPLPGDLLALPTIHFNLSALAAGLLAVAWLACMLTALWTTISALRQSHSLKHRNRTRYLLAALSIFIISDALIPADGQPGVYVGLLGRLVGYSLITFALQRHDLPDVRRGFLRALRLALLVAVTVALYLGTFVVVGYLSGAVPDLARWQVVGPALLLALTTAAVVDVLMGPRLHRWFDRLLLGRAPGVQTALGAYSRQLNMILDLDRLADITLDWLSTSLNVKRSAFILFTLQRGGRVELTVVRSTFDPLPPTAHFDRDSRFVAHLMNIQTPLSQYDLDMLAWFQVMAAQERQWLQSLGVDLYVPILVSEQPVALLGLGSHARGRPFSKNDVEILTGLAAQTATALEGAHLLDDLLAVQSDLHRLSTELAETSRQLKRLDQTKADFIAIASHELRTPLTQIYGYSDVLSSLTGDELEQAPEIHSFVDGISRGAERLKRVVDAMVDVSLIETGGLILQLDTFPVDYPLLQTVETLRPATDDRQINLEVADLSHLPPIQADANRLAQVFLSVLSNAIKYSPDGSEIQVTARLEPKETGLDYINLIVADPGIGIDPEQQDLIFEKFYRTESALHHSSSQASFKGGGPGLGLAIAKGIVVAHEGDIWVESPGRDEEHCPGSTFYIRLPVDGPKREVDHV